MISKIMLSIQYDYDDLGISWKIVTSTVSDKDSVKYVKEQQTLNVVMIMNLVLSSLFICLVFLIIIQNDNIMYSHTILSFSLCILLNLNCIFVFFIVFFLFNIIYSDIFIF
jgi:hypothetical protein